MIEKIGRKYVLKSLKAGKHVGTFTSFQAAKDRERHVNYFKHAKR